MGKRGHKKKKKGEKTNLANLFLFFTRWHKPYKHGAKHILPHACMVYATFAMTSSLIIAVSIRVSRTIFCSCSGVMD